MVLMDKIKEHSCAIQPAFGNGAFNGPNLGPNFALMIQQILNTDPSISVVNDPSTFLPPGVSIINILPDGTVVQQIHHEEDALHLQPHLNVAQTADNVQQHQIVPHGQNADTTLPSESNNVQVENFEGTVTITIQHDFDDPPSVNLTTMLNNSIQVEVVAGMSDNISEIPSQENVEGIPSNGYASYIAAFQPSPVHLQQQQAATELSNSLSSDPITETHPSAVPNISVPSDEESNSSIPPFHAPVSSSITDYVNDLIASVVEDNAQSAIPNFYVVDSYENSDGIDENQINNSDATN